jgi:hypothetical protein
MDRSFKTVTLQNIYSQNVYSQNVYSQNVYSQNVYSPNVYSQNIYTQNVYSPSVHILTLKVYYTKCIQIFPDFLSLLYHMRQIPNFINRIVIKSTVRAWVTAFGLG